MKLKKILLGLIILTIFTTTIAAKAKKADNNKIKIVTTIFPEYDWVREILGDKAENAEQTLLLIQQSLTPSMQDMQKL